MMRIAGKTLIAFALLALSASVASATPINLSLDLVTQVGGSSPSVQTYSPSLPLIGTGDIDFTNGTGTLTLEDHSITINLLSTAEIDARLDITGWTQTITSIDGSGNITSTGSGTVGCTNLGGFGNFVCAATPSTVNGWPANDSATLQSSATINYLAQTITIVDNSVSGPAGTITQHYSYSFVPEPGTGMLVTTGLMSLGIAGRRRR